MLVDGRTALPLLAVALAACASSGPAGPEAPASPAAAAPEDRDLPPVERAFVEGLSAVRRGDFPSAVAPLSRVAETCAGTEMGDHARLALLGVWTDPRNPERDLARAHRAAARWLASPSPASWLEPLVETLYLVTLDLGGAAQPTVADRRRRGAFPAWRAAGNRVAAAPPEDCERPLPSLGAREPRLPALPGRPLRDALSESERRRAELEEVAAALEARVAELEAELDRIRKTLRP